MATVLSENQLKEILGSRVTLQHDGNDKIIFDKEINTPLVMKDIISHYGAYIITLVFENCIFNAEVDIGDIQRAGTIIFRNCIFNNSLKIKFSNSSVDKACIFNNDFYIYLEGHNEIELCDFNINGTFEIAGSLRKLLIKNINIKGQVLDQKIIINCNLSQLTIDNVKGDILQFNHNVNLGRTKIQKACIKNLRIGSIVCNSNFLIDDCIIGNFKIDITTGSNRTLEIINSTITSMKLPISALLKTSIIRGSINTLKLWDANEDQSILNIEQIEIINLEFERIFNKGLITLREIRIPEKGVVSIKSSNLGKADFIYCNFSKAALEFENSKITEAFFSETEFPKIVFLNNKKNYGQAQLAFGQLATAFQKQGDNIRALEYNSRELEAHYRKIKWFSADFFQKLNLWLNSISNNFGRNWIRSAIFSFAVGLLFFYFLLVSTDSYKVGFPGIDFGLLPAYLKFMNPLRFFELETLFANTSKAGIIKLNGLSYLSDFLGRIFVTYGYYQTIQAFRRFGRK